MIEWYIEQSLQELHIMKRYCGHRLLVQSVALALEDESRLTEVKTRIYVPVARQFCCKPSNVERNIRTVCVRTWKDCREELCEAANYSLSSPPAASELIEIIVNYIQRVYPDEETQKGI